VTALSRAIAAREVQRLYLALIHGVPLVEHFSIDAPIGRDPVSRVKMAVVAGGRAARTDVSLLGSTAKAVPGNAMPAPRYSAVRCRLHTGRTHQIRVHLAHRGHPLVADTLYGGRPELGLSRQALHAQSLGFDHPATGQAMRFEAELPSDLAGPWRQVLGES
jgi:23S rRNA pseudouridine1911/1915/1917 synthase